MAAATVTNRSYGFRASGGVDATTVTSARVNVKSIILVNGAAEAASTATLTDYAGNAIAIMKAPNVNGESLQWDINCPIDGLKVTLSTANNVLLVMVA